MLWGFSDACHASTHEKTPKNRDALDTGGNAAVTMVGKLGLQRYHANLSGKFRLLWLDFSSTNRKNTIPLREQWVRALGGCPRFCERCACKDSLAARPSFTATVKERAMSNSKWIWIVLAIALVAAAIYNRQKLSNSE